jgi:hypothetical protein
MLSFAMIVLLRVAFDVNVVVASSAGPEVGEKSCLPDYYET